MSRKFKVLIDPWGAILIEDYKRIIEEFGLQPFTNEILEQLPNPNKLMRRKVVFCHRNLESITEAIQEKRPFYVLTGIMPSAEKLHLGNRMIVENVKYFQDLGAKTYLLVADIEACVTRGISLKEGRRRALEFHIPAYLALGMDPKNTFFYFQSENKTVMKLALEFSEKIALSEFYAIYGEITPGKIVASLLDVADIVYPQLKESLPGIIPVGIDQDPHLRLTRDIVKRIKQYKLQAPASMYVKFTPSLDGSFKMSKSKPESCMDIPEDLKTVEKKLKDAFTGGQPTLKEQKELGGRPEICVVFELFKQHLIENDSELDKIYEDCKGGLLLCGDCKEYAIELMKKFLIDFEEKLEKAREIVSELAFITQ